MSGDFYLALEERFRASREEIRARLEGYRPFLTALRSVAPRPRAFDIGCGRGEWLQLLVEEGFAARGVDLDDAMLRACHELGLSVEKRDALDALKALPDASLDLITAFHVVEHLKADYLRALLREAERTLAPHGLLIMETPNGENLIVGTNNFYFDPTHERPVPALFLDFLCQYSGFARSKIMRLQEDKVLHNEDAKIGIWQVLYGVSPDYAVVAQKHIVPVAGRDPFASLFAREYGLDLPTLANRHDERTNRHDDRLNWHDEQINGNNERINRHDERLDRHDERLDRHDERLDRYDQRLDRHDQQINRYDERLTSQDQHIASHVRRIDSHDERLRELGDVEAQVRLLQQRLHQLEERCVHAERAHDELRAVRNSRSWRITGPVRGMSNAVRAARYMALRATRNPIGRAVMFVRRKPSLMAVATRLVQPFPGLKARLRRSMTAAQIPLPVHEEFAAYSPRVVRLGNRMRQLAMQGRVAVGTPNGSPATPAVAPHTRPRLAYVSPLPPERTGIAHYSAELLPALARHFDIDVIVSQADVDAPGATPYCQVRDAAWLRQHAGQYHAVLYHIGNSKFHTWMIDLLTDVPGIIVLHDFFLGGLIWELTLAPGHTSIKFKELYHSHGYRALAECLLEENEGQVAYRYPFNRGILERATGVIVHSDAALRLARQWHGAQGSAAWRHIPHLRQAVKPPSRSETRSRLGVAEDAFLVCSFGLLGTTKLNHRLLHAWLASQLAAEPNGLLVFVGELGNDEYARTLRQIIARSSLQERIVITGWADASVFGDYLAAADVAVQLRTLSRGETSGTVLDCMNYGLPVIVNANGSMADLPEDVVYRLPDEFDDGQLVKALERLWANPQLRQAQGERARVFVQQEHAPARCADLYNDAINDLASRARDAERPLREALETLPPGQWRDENAVLKLAESMQPALHHPLHQPQLLVDITATRLANHHTGIERVGRALSKALIESPPEGWRVEPVYLTDAGGRWHYRYASTYSAGLLGIDPVIQDRSIDYAAGDRLIALDISGSALVEAARAGLFQRLRAAGVSCQMMVHDVLPITEPHCFPPEAPQHFARWLHCVVQQFDGAVCVSRAAAHALHQWLQGTYPDRAAAFDIDYSHHGADLDGSAPTRGLPDDAPRMLSAIRARPTVLMVGTLEPRKGYLQALDAFDLLWREGRDVNLVIVGREGWKDLPDSQRRSIPQLMQRLNSHPERGRRLLWMDGISDEYLDQIYAHANGLLAASVDEGFGLPLIEAAGKGMPILARDIPVFREVAGDHASYFEAATPEPLARAVARWVECSFQPPSTGMPWLTWRQSAANLARVLFSSRNRIATEVTEATEA